MKVIYFFALYPAGHFGAIPLIVLLSLPLVQRIEVFFCGITTFAAGEDWTATGAGATTGAS
jgi:hypothetical protein